MIATIGGLGYDLSEQEALERAKTTLESVAIKQGEWYEEMWTERDKNLSAVKANFKSQRLIETASRRVRQKAVKMDGAKGIVWVDRAKTWEELRPSRMCNAAQRWLQRELQDQDHFVEVCANQHRKVVQAKTADGVWTDLGAPGRESWVWKERATQLLTEAQLDIGSSFIERR